MQQAPARSLFNALGFTAEELKKPMVGIVSSYNEIVPGHMNIDKIVNAVKLGVAEAGGVPVVFPAIAVCDGIAMGHVGMKYSLVTRDLIADSTECMAIAHQFDALVMVPNCDKNVPGLLMAAARLNLPTVFVSGGPMLAGHVQGKKRSLSSMFEAVGSYAAGTMTEDDVLEYENKVCPTCGSCSGMYTANSMNCLTEALGMGLRGNGTIPAVYSERIKLAKHAGMAVMDMFRKNICARDIITKESITANTCIFCKFDTFRVNSRNRSVSAKSHTKSFGQTVHRVCGIHAGAGPTGRADFILIFKHVILCHGYSSVISPTASNMEERLLFFPCTCPARHRSTGYKYSRKIQTGSCHQKPRYILITVWHHNQCIKLMGDSHTLRGICNQVSGNQRIFHADMSHGNTITYRDCRKYNRYATCFRNAEFYGVYNFINIHMARNNFIVGTYNSDHWFFLILLR